MDGPRDITLSEFSPKEKVKHHMTHVEYKVWHKSAYLQNRNRLRHREQTCVASGGWGEWERDGLRV